MEKVKVFLESVEIDSPQQPQPHTRERERKALSDANLIKLANVPRKVGWSLTSLGAKPLQS